MNPGAARRRQRRPAPSLRATALQWLANREHSRSELRAKLLRKLAAWAAAAADAGGVTADANADSDAETAEAEAHVGAAAACAGQAAAADPVAARAAAEQQADALLDELQALGYLSEARFVESRLHARAARFGNRRIEGELAQHGLAPSAEQRLALRESELARARQVWLRRYRGERPADAAAKARQLRFMAARGFSSDVLRQLFSELPQA